MDNSEAVLIYAAGIGSRMKNVTSNLNKCVLDLGGILPLEHTVRSFYDNGLCDFIVVIGYLGEQVKERLDGALSDLAGKIRIWYVVNEFYDYHGCEYSIACAHSCITNLESLLITEGDMLLDPQYIRTFQGNTNENAVLIREKKYIDNKRSVIACGDESEVVRSFAYDEEHMDVMDLIPSNLHPLGESMQLWKISGQSLNYFNGCMSEYFGKANHSSEPMKENGLENINRVCMKYGMHPVIVEGSNCVNLNSQTDIGLAKNAQWIRKRQKRVENFND